MSSHNEEEEKFAMQFDDNSHHSTSNHLVDEKIVLKSSETSKTLSKK